MAATFTLYIDWNGDGDFSDAGEDVSARTLARSNVQVEYGRDQSRSLAPAKVGEASFELDNRSRDYSPDNGSSPLAGNVLPGRSVYLKGTLSAVDYTLFRGHLDDFTVRPEIGLRSIEVGCLDPLARLKGVRVSCELYGGLQTGQAIGVVLDAAGWSSTLRDLDPGATTVPWFWLRDTDAYDAVTQLVDSEGPGAQLSVGSDGSIVFRDRHHRLTSPASTTSQATFRDTGAEPNFSAPMAYDHGWKEIVNSVAFEIPLRQLSGALSAVWSTSGQYAIADGETLPISVSGTTPFMGAVTPVAGTDYTLLSGAVSVILSGTSGETVTIFITATGGPAVIADLQLRAYALATVATMQVAVEDSVSIGKYGRRSPLAARDPVWAGVHDALAIAELILAQRAERLPAVTITIRGGNDVRLLQQLARDLSDRIHIVETETGLDDDFYIEQIGHTVYDAGLMLETRFGCEKVADAPTGLLILDSATDGLLNTGKLGGVGYSDPTTVFLLDDSGQGLLNTGVLGF